MHVEILQRQVEAIAALVKEAAITEARFVQSSARCATHAGMFGQGEVVAGALNLIGSNALYGRNW